MTRLQAVGLCVVTASIGFTWPADAAGKYDAVIPAIDIPDTLKRVGDLWGAGMRRANRLPEHSDIRRA